MQARDGVGMEIQDEHKRPSLAILGVMLWLISQHSSQPTKPITAIMAIPLRNDVLIYCS